MKQIFRFLSTLVLALGCFQASATENLNPVDITEKLLSEAKTLDEKPLNPLADAYANLPTNFSPEATASKSLDDLGQLQMQRLVISSYNLPPSAMVPKVWLSLKMQAFYKEPIRLPSYVIYPKGFDAKGTKKYPVAILSHGSGGHIDLQLWYAYNLASKGFIVVIPDHFKPVGRECTPTDISTFRIEANAMDMVRLSDFFQNQPYVQKQNLFLLGWSLGGMSTEMAARSSFTNAIAPHLSYNAAVCFYPQIVVQELTPFHKSKILFIIAENDDYTPSRNILNYVERMHLFEGQKERVKYIVAKDSYHSFDRVPRHTWRDNLHLALYNMSTYSSFGSSVVNWIGKNVANLIFGRYAYHNLQTFKNGQIIIDTQNPLRGYLPLNEIQDHASLHDADANFHSWETFQQYFMTHVSSGARLTKNPETAKWAMEELLRYLESNLVQVAEVTTTVNTGKVD